MIKYSFKQHNWLIHYINNKSFKSTCKLIRGIVLDLGCGEKPFKKEIENLSDKYFGVDWLSTLHKKNEIDIYADMSRKLPFKSQSVDTIVSFQVMEHLQEPTVFLRESYRLLRQNGKIIFTVPFMWGVHEAPHDYYRYTKYGLRYLLEKAKFRNIIIKPNTGYWITAGLRLNYHLNRHNKGFVKPLFILLFWTVQKAAIILDRLDFNQTDTASYTVVAEK